MDNEKDNDNEKDKQEINISITIMYPLLVIGAILITPIYIVYGFYKTLRKKLLNLLSKLNIYYGNQKYFCTSY